MRKDMVDGYCNDMPLPSRVDVMWQKELLGVAFNSPHFVCADTIYFKNGHEVLSIKEGVAGYEDPVVVKSPAVLNRIYTNLGFSKNHAQMSKPHYC